MIVVEQQGQKNSKRKGNKDPAGRQVPKVDEPASVDGRVESPRYRQELNFSVFDVSWEVRKTGPEDGGKLRVASDHKGPVCEGKVGQTGKAYSDRKDLIDRLNRTVLFILSSR